MNDLELTDADVDRIVEALGNGGRVNIRAGNTGGDFSSGVTKVLNGLVIAGVVSLIGVVWSVDNKVSGLTAQVSYLSQEIALLRAKVP